MKKKLLWCMTVMTALLSASCSSELALEGAPNNGVAGEEVEVTFSISADGAQAFTRNGGPGVHQNRIGKGKEIDMLIYAVYEKNGDTYNLLEQYGRGIVNEAKSDNVGGADDGTQTAFDFEATEAIKAKKTQATDADGVSYYGQTILYVGEVFQDGGTKEITLRLMRNKEYHVAFWAQSSKTAAFKTNDLEDVEVIYANAKNNDELRDAFCKVESFSVSTESASRTVILTRPMAQINVGTTGADYKNLLIAERVSPNMAVTHSTITLKGVAQSINVVTDQIDGAETNLTDVTFNYDIIPAFKYVIEEGGATFPNLSAKTPAPTDEDYEFYYKGEDENEEFLKVDLDYDGKISDYKTNYPTIKKETDDADNVTTKFLTEEFKYLSMCYVLVPASRVITGEDGKTVDTYASSVLPNVTVAFAQGYETDDESEMPKLDFKDYKTIDLTNVPVHRNWRTNILGGLKWMKDPTDPDPDYPDNPEDPEDPNTPPDGPEDETTIFKYYNPVIYLDPMFKNEYNGTPSEDEATKDEWIDYPLNDEDSNSEDNEETGSGNDGGDSNQD